MNFLKNYFFNYMREKIHYKKNQIQLKKQLTKLLNQGNLVYLGKPVNHVNFK
jgi:hypothetical protein